jgi:ankyrin repeat protein
MTIGIKRFQEIAAGLLKNHYGLELNDTHLCDDVIVLECIKQGYRPYQVVAKHASEAGLDRVDKDERYGAPSNITVADEDAVIQHLPIPSIVFAAEMSDHTKAMSMYEAFAKGSGSVCSQNHDETRALFRPNKRTERWFLQMLEKGRGYLTSEEQGSTFDNNQQAKENGVLTPLHLAASFGRTGFVQALLDSGLKFGADANAKNSYGSAPLHWAAGGGRTEVVQLLLASGADANSKDSYGCTPLHLAAMNGHPETVQVLVASGASVNVTNSDGFTPLHSAAMNGLPEIAHALLAGGADANAKNRNSNTPLHWATMNGRTDVVKVLLACGADLNITNSDGFTPLQLAASLGRTETVQLLRDASKEKVNFSQERPQG